MMNIVLCFGMNVISIEKVFKIAEILQGIAMINVIMNLIMQTNCSVINFEYCILNLYIVR
jgi:hypothetical protein